MDQVVTILATIAGLSILPIQWKLRRTLRTTTLATAWSWSAAAWFIWAAAWTADHCERWTTRGVVDQLWYAVGIALVTPTIAVLGAKRPVSRVWGWFVLLPLVLVLGWPAVAAWGSRFPHGGWSLEAPVLAGYSLVVLMGVGNYIGTRCSIPALLWGVALMLFAGPLCPPVASRLPSPEACRTWGTIAWAGSVGLGAWQWRNSGVRESTLECAWRDFQDMFGIVWGRRIQERFNATSRECNWPVLLSPRGFVAADGTACNTAGLPARVRSEMEHALRWLLRRFVDSDWIDLRCGVQQSACHE